MPQAPSSENITAVFFEEKLTTEVVEFIQSPELSFPEAEHNCSMVVMTNIVNRGALAQCFTYHREKGRGHLCDYFSSGLLGLP